MNLKLVHQDKRGEIYILEEKGREVATILTTKKGFARGGCVHKENEWMDTIKGEVDYYPNSAFTFKGTPHYFISNTDSIVMEWGANIKNTTKDKKLRSIVDEINKSN